MTCTLLSHMLLSFPYLVKPHPETPVKGVDEPLTGDRERDRKLYDVKEPTPPAPEAIIEEESLTREPENTVPPEPKKKQGTT